MIRVVGRTVPRESSSSIGTTLGAGRFSRKILSGTLRALMSSAAAGRGIGSGWFTHLDSSLALPARRRQRLTASTLTRTKHSCHFNRFFDAFTQCRGIGSRTFYLAHFLQYRFGLYPSVAALKFVFERDCTKGGTNWVRGIPVGFCRVGQSLFFEKSESLFFLLL